jgi:CubicO group peptidase (beta-lactamase class C family)
MSRIIIFFLLVVNFAQGQTTIESKIETLMQEFKAVGLSVAVIKNNKEVYKNAFGKKNIEENKNLETYHIFRIASISKSFTATAIMQLVEAKKLSLDADLSDLIGFTIRNPSFPEVPITLKMVLSHTSSINDSEGYFTLDAINSAKNLNFANCFNSYAPGKGYEYCNLNFNLAGTIIENFSGQRFDQYVVQNILKPLNLYGGYCIDSLDQNLFATIYEYDKETKQFNASPGAYNPRREEIRNYILGYSTPIFSPTGGMKISASHLAAYMKMHMNHGRSGNTRIISKKSSKQMQTPLSEKDHYGLALWRTDNFIKDVSLVGHTGSAYGLYSSMFFNPKKKFGIVAITNGCTEPENEDGYNDFLKKISELLYKEIIINQ